MSKMVMLVGGTFDDNGGKSSGYFAKLSSALALSIPGRSFRIINGGHFDDLARAFDSGDDPEHIVWMADCPNDKPKIVREIKTIFPKCILVTSKRNDGGKYSFMDLMFQALHLKANLLVEFVKGAEGLVSASVYDPLGNAFGMGLGSPEALAGVVVKRMMFLATMTRQKSVQDGPALDVPNKPAFFNLVRDYADMYHSLIHASNTTQMLGNVSFRCEKGFPSFRHGEVVYVSKRNMDKRMIGQEGFVAVDLDDATCVRYCGDVKPSVDTPIQTALYRKFPQFNYMLHSHVYIEGAPMTGCVIPCGAMEEYDEIVEIVEKSGFSSGFRLNLRGHGSLVMGETLDPFINIPYVARKFPEAQA